MTELTERLKAALDEVIEKGTFTVAAAEGIKALRDEHASATTRLEEITRELSEAYTKLTQTEKELMALREKAESVNSLMATYENRMQALEVKDAVHAAHLIHNSELMEILRLVFRNPTIRRSETGNEPLTVKNGPDNEYLSSGFRERETKETIE